MEQWEYKIAFIEAGGMGYYRLREADERGMIGNGASLSHSWMRSTSMALTVGSWRALAAA